MAHIHEKIDFGVEAFIVHKNKVLLRMHDKYGLWLPPGGHIDLDEDPTEAAVREAREEVGLDITLRGYVPPFRNLEPGNSRAILAPRFMGRHNINETHEHVVFYYFASSESDKVVAGGEDRSDEWKWFTMEDLTGTGYEIRAEIRHYATEALKAAKIERW